MKKINKLLSTILCLVIIVCCFAAIPVSALTYPAMGEISSNSGKAAIYSLPGTYGHETAENKNKSKWLCDLTNGTQIKALGIEKDGDGDPWYKINYGENFANTGYAFVNRVLVNYEFSFDEDFEENLKNFPESYHKALRQLHIKYPNWKFVANDLDLTFKEAVEKQYGVSNVKNTRKWVEFTYGGNEWRDMRAYDSATDKWITLEKRWTYASRAAIEYFMDPRNSLNEDMIFAFMQQSYQEEANMKDSLRTVIKGTFLENGYDKNGDGVAEKDAYIEDLIAAAKESKVSPYVLAAAIIVEQGVGGTSSLISGVYSGYVGYYNFFNFNATGSTEKEIVENGLKYAKNNGWNSRSAAIIGGAKKYADGYISVGQDTYYYKDFNVLKEYWGNQYASALYDAWTKASYLKKGFITNNESTATFSIPVYEDMPSAAYQKPYFWQITPSDTGVYKIIPNSDWQGSISSQDLMIYDKQNNRILYNENKKGWPLVKNQNYNIYLNSYYNEDIISNITWQLTKVTDTIFPDTDANGWYNEAVIYSVGRGIIGGYGNGNFGTSDSIQRQDFLVMLARLDGVDLSQYENSRSKFSDVAKNSYYEAAVNWGYENKIVTGYQNGKFGVGDKITREQLVVFLCRYADYKNKGVDYKNETKENASRTYSDYTDVSEWAVDSVLWALEKGVIKGKTKTTIVPQGNAERCEVAQILYNIFLNDIF